MVSWIYEADSYVPLGKLEEDQGYVIASDYLGRAIGAFDEQGDLIWKSNYDIYGRVKYQGGDRNFVPFRQLGQFEDTETGLYYNRFRYYNPETGSYISSDPIGLASGEFNFYSYVRDSNTEVDPLGEAAASIVRHHLIPQEMIRNEAFTQQLENIGIKDPVAYIHRQTENITEGLHKKLHKGPRGVYGTTNLEFGRVIMIIF